MSNTPEIERIWAVVTNRGLLKGIGDDLHDEIKEALASALSTVPPEQSDEDVAREILHEHRYAIHAGWHENFMQLVPPIITRHVQARTGKLESLLHSVLNNTNCHNLMPTSLRDDIRAALAERTK